MERRLWQMDCPAVYNDHQSTRAKEVPGCCLPAVAEAHGDTIITEQGFSYRAEILLLLNRLPGIRFSEAPFTPHYEWKPKAAKMRAAARHLFKRKTPEKDR